MAPLHPWQSDRNCGKTRPRLTQDPAITTVNSVARVPVHVRAEALLSDHTDIAQSPAWAVADGVVCVLRRVAGSSTGSQAGTRGLSVSMSTCCRDLRRVTVSFVGFGNDSAKPL